MRVSENTDGAERPGMRGRGAGAVLAVLMLAMTGLSALPANADPAVPISGSGSTASQRALDQWRRDVAERDGLTVNFSGTGSTAGRQDFIRASVDFAVSELPFQRAPQDGSAPEIPSRGFAYLPAVADGTALIYNLRIDGVRVTDLRLSGEVVAKIFAGTITRWNDAAIRADNPHLALPDRPLTPVVRADSSGSSAQLTAWLAAQYPQIWTRGTSALFPTLQLPVHRALSGSQGVSAYVSGTPGEGAIAYVEASHAATSGSPVAMVRNAAGAWVGPGAANVTAALASAEVENDAGSPDYLTQVLDGVYESTDPAAYPISSYSYLIVPTDTAGGFTAAKGATLGAFARYLLCEGQSRAAAVGYAPLPANLVAAGREQIARIPGGGSPACASSAPPDGAIALEAAVLASTDGPLSLAAPVAAEAEMHEPAIVDGRSVSTGSLPVFSVVDRRAASRPGYTISASMGDFESDSGTIPVSSLTVTPAVIADGTTSAGVIPAAATIASSGRFPFATAPQGAGVGTTVLSGGLRLEAPAGAPGGTYRSTMTLTLVSR